MANRSFSTRSLCCSLVFLMKIKAGTKKRGVNLKHSPCTQLTVMSTDHCQVWIICVGRITLLELGNSDNKSQDTFIKWGKTIGMQTVRSWLISQYTPNLRGHAICYSCCIYKHLYMYWQCRGFICIINLRGASWVQMGCNVENGSVFSTVVTWNTERWFPGKIIWTLTQQYSSVHFLFLEEKST